jgi:hypothetical protein
MLSRSVGIMTSDWDTWINEDELPSLEDEDLAWFKDECGLSREDLFRICARAKEIVQELKLHKPDDLFSLTYDTSGSWYIDFIRSEPDGRWRLYFWREDQSVRQQADKAVVK